MCDLVQESVLGRGSYGEVKKVKKDTKDYALKLFLGQLESSLTEIDVLMRVKSSNLIEGIEIRKWTNECSAVFDTASSGVLENLITGDIHGKNLKSSSSLNLAPLPYPEMLKLKREILTKFLAQSASALKCLSNADYYHLDIKPENIFYKALPQIQSADDINFYVGDYGLCLPLDSPSPNPCKYHLAGTPMYFDPSFITTGKVSETSPVWALGISALELLSGEEWLERLEMIIKIRPGYNTTNNVLYASPYVKIWASSILNDFLSQLRTRGVGMEEISKWEDIQDLLLQMVDINPLKRPTPYAIARKFYYDNDCVVENQVCDLNLTDDELLDIYETLLFMFKDQNQTAGKQKLKIKVFCLALQYLLRSCCDDKKDNILNNLDQAAFNAMTLAAYFYHGLSSSAYVNEITQDELVSYIFEFNNGHIFGNSLYVKSLKYENIKYKLSQIEGNPTAFRDSFALDFDDMLSLNPYIHQKDKIIDFFD